LEPSQGEIPDIHCISSSPTAPRSQKGRNPPHHIREIGSTTTHKMLGV